jgi:tRNA (mo5U34)-methyltransferase
MMNIVGFVDVMSDQQVAGWAADLENLTHALQIELVVDGRVVGVVDANLDRPDLSKLALGSTRFGFLSNGLPREDHDRMVCRVKGTDFALPHSNEPAQPGFLPPSDEIFEKACRVGWFHSVPFGRGRFTPGHKSRAQMDKEIGKWRFPLSLTGKTMLDIGCADGGWAVEALQRGAGKIVAIDDQQVVGRKFLEDNGVFPAIEFRTLDLFSNAFLNLDPADFVLFAGVLYHVHDPIEALRRVRRMTKEFAILETHIDNSLGTDKTYAVFYEKDECANDSTNWWGPNLPCLEAWIRVAGFRFEMTSIDSEIPQYGRVSYMLWPA